MGNAEEVESAEARNSHVLLASESEHKEKDDCSQ